jgi:hypothetical protein
LKNNDDEDRHVDGRPNQYSIIVVDCNWTRFTAKLTEQFIDFSIKFIKTNFKRWLVEIIYSQKSIEYQRISISQ